MCADKILHLIVCFMDGWDQKYLFLLPLIWPENVARSRQKHPVYDALTQQGIVRTPSQT